MLALFLSLGSCEKDDAFEAANSTENQINNHESYKLETGSFYNLDDKKLARGLLSLNQQQLINSKGKPFSIEIDTSYYNLLIDRDTNKKHYTFALKTQKGEAYKNIIFTTKTDGTYKTTLAEYNVDQTQLMGIVRGDRSVIIPESDRVFTTILVSEDFQTAERCDAVCLDVEAIRVEGSPCQEGIHDYGEFCAYLGGSGAATAGYWIFQQNECGNCGASGGDGPGGMPDTNNGNGNTGEYGSGGSGSTDNDDVATTPTISLERQRRLNFLAELSEEERNCFQNNLSKAQTEAIYNFLESTDGPTDIIGLFYVPEKVAFAKAAITAQCENSDAEVDWEEKIIRDASFVNNSKINCVYEKLKENGGLKSIISGFVEESNEVQLIFKVTPNLNCGDNSDINGCTTAKRVNDALKQVVVEFDEGYINQMSFSNSNYDTPLIFLSKTLLHESIHASLHLAVDTGNLPYDANFDELYNQYIAQENWQHNLMAAEYINIISQGLNNVHPLLSDQQFIDYYSDLNNWNWSEFYTSLSWNGLSSKNENDDYIYQAAQEYFSNTNNLNNYNYYNIEAATNSNDTPNCN